MNRNRRFARSLISRIHPPTANLGDGLAGKTPKALRNLADQARARRDFTADTYYRRRLCELESERAGNWIQYGHALKESGYHQRAEVAYRRALDLLPNDPDLQMQLGHLAKVRGDFPAADLAFSEADRLGYPARDEIAFQRSLLRKIDNRTVFRDESPSGERVPLRIFLSVPGGPISEGDRAGMEAGLGHGDYSYAFAMRGFVNALEALDVDHVVIRNPEFIADIRQRSNAVTNVHLSFYPPERMRLLKGAYNINCFAWEFDRLRLPRELLTAHAFGDQARMLDLADEIWMPSEHGADAVRPSLKRPVRVVPAPVIEHLSKSPRTGRPSPSQRDKSIRALSGVAWQPLAIVPRIQAEVNGGSKAREMRIRGILDNHFDGGVPNIFVSVFNAHDYRKQISPMLNGFIDLLKTHPNSILLFKMTTVDRGGSVNEVLYREQIRELDSLTPPMISDKVWITNQVLTRAEMNALFDFADHYVCTSHAEGQNLPLIEAMGRGVVPVSVSGTAMDAYIAPETAVVIESERRPFGRRLTARYGLYGLETYFTEADWVRGALIRAIELDNEAYGEKSAAALERVKDVYGLEPFERAFNDMAARVTSSVAG